MKKDRGKMRVVLSAEVIGRQTLERLTEVFNKALTECEGIAPIVESLKVKEPWLSQIQYQFWRQKRVLRARLSRWSSKDWRSSIFFVAKIVAVFAAPVIAAIVTYFLNKSPE